VCLSKYRCRSHRRFSRPSGFAVCTRCGRRRVPTAASGVGSRTSPLFLLISALRLLSLFSSRALRMLTPMSTPFGLQSDARRPRQHAAVRDGADHRSQQPAQYWDRLSLRCCSWSHTQRRPREGWRAKIWGVSSRKLILAAFLALPGQLADTGGLTTLLLVSLGL